jgi:hypothetical protein
MSKNRNITGFLSFTLTVAGLILFLKVMNLLPLTAQKGALREYDSIEQVRSALSLQPIFVPSYFPQEISWPPAKILAQESPFPALIMSFSNAEKNKIVLVLTQASGNMLQPGDQFEIVNVREQVPFLMHGKNATLTVGECRDREPCSRITWSEDKFQMTVQMRSAPFELVRIAESIHP